VVVLVGLTLGLTAFLVASQPAATDSAEVLARLGRIEEGQSDLAGLAREVRELRSRLDRRLGALERRREGGSLRPLGADGARAAGLESADGEASATGDAALDAGVAARLERAVEAKMEMLAARQRNRGEDGRWKPPIGELARELGLDDPQQRKLDAVFRSARDEVFAILGTERPDGTSLLDDFAHELKETEDYGKTVGWFFGRLVKERVPGTQQTYLAASIELSERVQAQAQAHLDERQRTRFQELQLDVLEVNTGYDPVGDYIKERLSE